jgi:hypothetical protein
MILWKAKRPLHPEMKIVHRKAGVHQQHYWVASGTPSIVKIQHTPQSSLDEIIADHKMRTALAYLHGGGEVWQLGAETKEKLKKWGLISDSGKITLWGEEVIAEFKKWLVRQRHHLDSLVGDAQTREGEYYTPMELTLAKAPIKGMVPLGKGEHGVNGSYRLTLEATPDPVTAIFKPSSEEADERPGAVEQGTLYRRERAAYEIDQELHLGLVPPCVIRKFKSMDKEMLGSLSYWEAGDPAWIAGTAAWTQDSDPEELKAMAAFDYMILTDRHTGNFLLDYDHEVGEGQYKLWAIDHGYSLPVDSDMGMAMYQSAPHSWVSSALSRKLSKKFLDKLHAADQTKLRDKLQRLGIEDEAITGFIGRLNQIIKSGEIPKYHGVDVSAN